MPTVGHYTHVANAALKDAASWSEVPAADGWKPWLKWQSSRLSWCNPGWKIVATPPNNKDCKTDNLTWWVCMPKQWSIIRICICYTDIVTCSDLGHTPDSSVTRLLMYMWCMHDCMIMRLPATVSGAQSGDGAQMTTREHCPQKCRKTE